MDTLKKLSYIFNRKQKLKIFFLAIVIVGGALCELLGVTAVLPLVDVVVSPDSIFENDKLSYFYNLFHMQSTDMFLVFLIGVLIAIYIIKNVYLLVMNYMIYRFTYNNQKQLAYRMLKTYLKQPYTFFLNHSSPDLMRNVSDDTSMLFDTVLSSMQLAVEFIVCGLLLVYLTFLDKSMTLGVGFVLGAFLLFFAKFMKKNIQRRGQIVRSRRVGMSKWLLQTFGGIKETKIMGKENYFLKNYDREYSGFAENHCMYQTMSYLPKPLMETICICSVLLVMAIKLVSGVDSEYFISTISVFAVAAFRLLPAFNRITGYLSRIMFNKSGVDEVYKDLREIEELEKTKEQPKNSNQKLCFEKEIKVKDISFTYPNTAQPVLEHTELVIPKNKSTAFVGPSGAGKTTLADIILGVLTPQEGNIYADDTDVFENMEAWHEKIGYIPQSIYLLDDTIKNNIAYGMKEEDIDEERIQSVLAEAQLKDFVDGLEDGINMMIGERGIRLSGGQRQRLGIARALYTNPDILVLDEATSALDNETEAAVMDAINSLAGKKTLVIIAHRLSTIENCDFVYEVKDKKATLIKHK